MCSFFKFICYIFQRESDNYFQLEIIKWLCTVIIPGDPGAVSWVGRKGGTKVFKYGQKSPWYQLSPNYFQKFKRMLAPDWAQKNASYYCAQSANSFSWVLFVSSPHLPGSFTKLVHARETFIFYFPNQKRRNYQTVRRLLEFLEIVRWELVHKGLFHPYMKTFIPPFLPTRLTAPGSPRMYSHTNFWFFHHLVHKGVYWNQTSSPVLSHGAICFWTFQKIEFSIFYFGHSGSKKVIRRVNVRLPL